MPKINIISGGRGNDLMDDWEGYLEGYKEVKVDMDTDVRFLRATVENKIMPDLLRNLLEQPTPHGYEKLLHRHMPFLKRTDLTIMSDSKGNIIVDIGKVGKDFTTAFSCHMDTVHTTNQRDLKLRLYVTTNKGKKSDKLEAGMVFAGLPEFDAKGTLLYTKPSVLGADDKVGVYILCRMIDANIPGRYMFHVGEERGCVGSHYIADHTPKVLAGINRAIAFDRMNYGDVIAHQKGDRGSSITFSNALATTLNKYMPPHQQFKGDVIGMFTDTGSYHKLVPECCNLSVGYFEQHGAKEHFDLVWLEKILLPAILKADFEKLPTERDPSKPEVRNYGYNNNYHNNNTSSRHIHTVAYDKITALTSTLALPAYDITEGYITKCTREGMEALAKEWLYKASTDYNRRGIHAKNLTQILAERHNLHMEVENLKKVLIGAVDGPRFKQQYKCAMIDRINTDWEAIVRKGHAKANIASENIVRMKHLSMMLDMYYSDNDFRDIKLGLAFGPKYTEKLNMFMMKVSAAASVFKENDKKLKKHLGEIVRYMWENQGEPIFEKYKEELNAWPEVIRNKNIKMKPQTAAKPAEPAIKETDVSNAIANTRPKINDCIHCEGTGWKTKHFGAVEEVCWLCQGKATKLKLADLGASRDSSFLVCSTCNGSGQVGSGICYTCKGNGESTITKPHVTNLGSVLEPVKGQAQTDASKPTVH